MTPFRRVKCTNKFIDTRQAQTSDRFFLLVVVEGNGKGNLWVNDDNVVYFYRKSLIYGFMGTVRGGCDI